MKKAAIVLSGLTWVAASALGQTPTPTSDTAIPVEEHAGIVKSVRGNVQLLGVAGGERAARAGDAVAPIDRLVTEADSAASVVLRDGTTIIVGPSSRLDLKEFHFDSTTQDGGMLVSLLRGSLRMVTGLIGKSHPDAVRVETPTAVVGIRGTDFIVQTEPQP